MTDQVHAFVDQLAKALELAGVAIIVGGVLLALSKFRSNVPRAASTLSFTGPQDLFGGVICSLVVASSLTARNPMIKLISQSPWRRKNDQVLILASRGMLCASRLMLREAVPRAVRTAASGFKRNQRENAGITRSPACG